MTRCLDAADALAYLADMRRQSAYGVTDGRVGERLELSSAEETRELMAQCSALLYPEGTDRQ